MRTLSLPRVLLASAVSAMLGFGLAELRRGDAQNGPSTSSAARAGSFSAARSGSASPPAAQFDEDAASLWQTAQVAADPTTRSDALNRLSTLISESRRDFEEMLRRYDPRADPETRSLMRSLLAGDSEHRAEVMEFSLELAASADRINDWATTVSSIHRR